MVHFNQPYQMLIADDDPGFRETLRMVLEPYFSLFEASSGEEAVAIGGTQDAQGPDRILAGHESVGQRIPCQNALGRDLDTEVPTREGL